MSSLKENTKKLLNKYQIRPSKRLGQNFLIDKRVIEKEIEAADLKPSDIVLEVGPGVGTLTQELAERVRKVIAVEKDPKMCQILKKTLAKFSNIEVIQGNILKIKSQITNHKLQTNSKAQIPKIYKIVANLPFYLTAPFIRKFLETKNPPKEMVLIIQKEVAQRISARPPKMSVLAVSVQFYAEPKIISYVSKKSFWPQPKVDSAIIKIIPKNLQSPELCKFFEIVKAGFSQPRKQLINNLSTPLNLERKIVEDWLSRNNIKPSQRAETLTIEDWLNLTKSFTF